MRMRECVNDTRMTFKAIDDEIKNDRVMRPFDGGYNPHAIDKVL